jgi:hypothetical protein
MTASAQQQFLFAMSHIYRGHASEAVGHIRRAIEGAGIAYLTVSKPEIAEYFQVSDMKKLRNATGTNTILPLDNPVTAPLNKSIEIASAMIHNNYISFASRLEPNIRQDGESWTFSATLYAHEGDLQTILNITLWTFRVMERIARLIASSFELNPCDWFTSLDSIRLQIDKLYVDLNQIVNPEST